MSIEKIIEPRNFDIGSLKVKRVLPFRALRTIGPWTFLDHMGPIHLPPGQGDVLAHPHIGLSTVTYLFEGELLHRDSIGSKQMITPNDVNWMTAGKGIVHSERIPQEGKRQLHGLQAWVALPLEHEEVNPSFDHYPHTVLPFIKNDGIEIRIIAGEAFGKKSPVKTHSKLFYFEAKIEKNKSLVFDPGTQEAAFYVVSGKVRVGDEKVEEARLIIFKKGEEIKLTATEDVHGVFLGGEPLEGPRHIWWNFVSSSQERIERAKEDWKNQNMGIIPDETGFVPLPL
jgi:redox-sensitive bicupin YhaK (pirin superfamily)